jgi:hypothetical protein
MKNKQHQIPSIRQPRVWNPKVSMDNVKRLDHCFERLYVPPVHPRQQEMDEYRKIKSLYR